MYAEEEDGMDGKKFSEKSSPKGFEASSTSVFLPPHFLKRVCFYFLRFYSVNIFISKFRGSRPALPGWMLETISSLGEALPGLPGRMLEIISSSYENKRNSTASNFEVTEYKRKGKIAELKNEP